MFGDYVKKNRRFTPKEFEQELEDARIWHRRPRQYIFDKPDYNTGIFEPVVNFSLNYIF